MKDETTINSYELTLTPNYVSDWNFNDALRELIQNGTDQEVLDPDNEFQIDYSQKEKVLRLKNRKSVLKINTLLLGRSSKANNEDTVGQFGEGYKIAALVLNRLGKTFTIYNNEKNEVWESRFKNSEKWLEKILCFYVSKRKTDDHGLCIEVGNVTQGEFNDLYRYGSTWTIATTAKRKRSMEKSSWTKHMPEKCTSTAYLWTAIAI